MTTNKLLLLIFLVCASNGYGQDSTVSDAVRAMIERDQVGSHFDQIARMQVAVQYGEFLESFAGDEQRSAQVEAALVEVLSERAELSARVVSGQASETALKEASEYTYLRARLAPILNSAELTLLDSFKDGPSDAQLKQDYAEELSLIAADLTEANSELVLDTLVKHIRSDRVGAGVEQLGLDELVMQQGQSLRRAREELQSQLSGTQLEQANMFLDQLQSNLYMNRAMSDPSQ